MMDGVWTGNTFASYICLIFNHSCLFLTYRSGKGIHLLIIISGQGEKLETKLGLQGEMEK
jgi:hypothetical protein